MTEKKTPSHVTLGQIAETSGYSRSTVSRALRNHPHLPESTCKKIQALAAEMGWTPDPEATRLMRYLQSTKTRRIESALAFINDCEEREHLQQSEYTRLLIKSARNRAESLGFHLEEIWLRQKGMTSSRVDQILRTRGIKGVLIPPEKDPLPTLDLDWSRLAVVATTTTALPKLMNRVLPDNYYNMNRLMDTVLATGCQRPFLISSHDLESRCEYAPLNIYLSRTVEKGLKPQPVFFVDEAGKGDRQEKLHALLAKSKPDFLILPDVWVREWLGEFSERPWATYAVKVDGAPGVDQRVEAIGSAAVDVLTAHVNRGECGLPEIPRVLHVRGLVS